MMLVAMSSQIALEIFTKESVEVRLLVEHTLAGGWLHARVELGAPGALETFAPFAKDGVSVLHVGKPVALVS